MDQKYIDQDPTVGTTSQKDVNQDPTALDQNLFSVKKDAYPMDNTSICLRDPLLVVIIYCYKFKDDFNEAIFFLMLRISKESKVSVDGDKAGDEVT